MANGHSLHIGLNFVDPGHYEGWDGQLGACEFDARDMLALAKKRKFASSRLLLNGEATAAAVIEGVREASKKLVSGDLFLLTYAGHGGQVRDVNGDEKDGMDETWVLYDRMLVDDELYDLWAKFKSGVRILVLSDSCHSGTMARMIPPFISGRPRFRAMPRATNDLVYAAHKREYDKIQKSLKSRSVAKVNASIVLVSGCMDNQLSSDGDRNGLFTQTLKKVWNNGKFKGDYRRLRDAIVTNMPDYQTPNYSLEGKRNSAFEKQVPFTI